MTESLASHLAGRVLAMREQPLPPAVVARARDLLRDYLGVALGGTPADSSNALRAGLRSLATGGGATVLGTHERLPAPDAALANGAAAHALEMDDTHRGGSIHLGATVFSAALAAAEVGGATGARVLAAAVGGYEVAGRLARALDPAAHYQRGFHPTGTCGTFGAATAAGLVLGLDRAGLARALGIAGSQAAGSMEFLADGTWTKRLHPGWAACAGLHAAALARAGFTAPASILEGRFGFLRAYSERADPRLVTSPSPADAADYELCRTSIKPHACCRYMQGPIDAALALRTAHGIDPGAVERIEVGMLGAGFAIVCEPAEAKRRPVTVVDLQFSLPFGIAVALVRGAASPEEFTTAALEEPALRRLLDRVVGVRDPRLDDEFPEAWPSWVRIHLADGRQVESRIRHPLGDPENFPGAEVLLAKFRVLAGRVLAPAGVGRLAAAVDAFADAPDVSTLLAAAVPTVT